MDKPCFPNPDGHLALEVAGEAWCWRLITPEGRAVSACAPDASAARRSAAFAAAVVGALARGQQRRF